MGIEISRRKLITGATAAGGLFLAGCSKSSNSEGEDSGLSKLGKKLGRRSKSKKGTFASLYGPLPNEKFPVPAIPEGGLEPRYYRQQVNYRTREKVGSLIVDIPILLQNPNVLV